jgi:ammonia channel protein AmtB
MGIGFWGTLMASFLADPSFVQEGQEGVFYGGDGKQLGYQIMAVAAYAAWALGTFGIMFGILNYLGIYRVEREVELMGLDDHHHGGYS